MSSLSPSLNVPYFNQWEAPELAAEIVAKRLSLKDVAQWRASGAKSQHEFIEWASHVCGMCCLKMALAATRDEIIPTLELTRRSLPYGTYVREGDNIRGLIYSPFVDFVREEWDIEAQVCVDIDVRDIARELENKHFFIASVHPSIRQPASSPPKRGGHLVLVSQVEQGVITFHNPSGDVPASQSNVRLPLDTFSRFFAGRGIALIKNTGR
ncbi:hypothetical protein [Rouxiella sp. Mn2063]|uniref:hypothetical protein n=1 Tax=Rouxiella sp. Mn2063 TaxID=3395262 RepID=UPI003BE00B53